MKRLFIAEKPSLADAIANGLGNKKRKDGYFECGSDVVTWCYGHILRQYTPEEYDEKYKAWKLDDLPIAPQPWKLKVADGCKKQYDVIKKLSKEAEIIVNAGDPDREGQLLVDEVLIHACIMKSKPIQRILLNALDDKSVKSALNDIRDNDDFIGLRNSALARSRADWLVGMNISRLYTIRARKSGYNNVVSVGRVQTPTVSLVARRELEIKNFKPVNFFRLKAFWNSDGTSFPTFWEIPDDTSGLNPDGRLLSKEPAENVAKKISGKAGKVIFMEQKPGTEKQRLPYSLSTLQIDAGKAYGYTPAEVLEIQQSLYEKKLTSYPRSDCEYLPVNQKPDASTILNNLKDISSDFAKFVDGSDTSISSKAWNDKKITAHHAIIPTTVKPNFESLSEKELNMYMLVAKAYIAQFYPPQKFLSTKVEILCEDDKFKATGRVIEDLGWKALYKNTEKKADDDNSNIPNIKEGDVLPLENTEIVLGVTKPPERFTPSTLVQAMKEIWKYVKDEKLKPVLKECSGIGTEATRAGIIDLIQKRNFVTIEKKKLVPTELGYFLIKYLPESLTYPDTTATWEQDLEEICEKNNDVSIFESRQLKFIESLLQETVKEKIETSKSSVVCPDCGSAMIRRKGKTGFFWGCSGYPNCKKTFPDKNGKPDTAAKAKPKAEVSDKYKCPDCGKPLAKRNGKNGAFWGCTGYPNCKQTFNDDNNKPVFDK